MTNEEKQALKLASIHFNIAPHVERIVETLRTKRHLNQNEIGLHGTEIAREWIQTDVPHEWDLYTPNKNTKKGKTFYYDSAALGYIIKKTAREVNYIMSKELRAVLKKSGILEKHNKPIDSLWYILDYFSCNYLHAHQNKIYEEKNKKAGVSFPHRKEYPIEPFNIPNLAQRIVEEPLWSGSSDIQDQLGPIAETVAATIDNIDPKMKYVLTDDIPDIDRKLRFLFSSWRIFELLENELCMIFASNKLARSSSQTPEDLCVDLRSIVIEKLKAMAS